jgi:hypothetical protein
MSRPSWCVSVLSARPIGRPRRSLRERLRVASPCLPRRSRGASASDVWSLTVPSPSPPADHHDERRAHPEKHQGRSRRGRTRCSPEEGVPAKRQQRARSSLNLASHREASIGDPPRVGLAGRTSQTERARRSVDAPAVEPRSVHARSVKAPDPSVPLSLRGFDPRFLPSSNRNPRSARPERTRALRLPRSRRRTF